MMKFILSTVVLWIVHCSAQYSDTLVLNPYAQSDLKWQSICMSSAGQYISAVANTVGVYTSLDYGYSWSQTLNVVDDMNFISYSSNSSYVLASSDGGLYLSDDYGSTWSTVFNAGSYYGVAVSGTGEYMYVVENAGGIEISSDYGKIWSNKNVHNLYAIVCSSSGKYVAAIPNNEGGYPYVSSNYGGQFTEYESSIIEGVYSIAMSASGQYISIGYTVIYYSNTYGTTWNEATAPGGSWFAIAMDFSGSFQITADQNGGIYYSDNYGVSWSTTESPEEGWVSITVSGDGMYIAAAVNSGGVYWNPYSPTSRPSISPTAVPSASPTTEPSSSPTIVTEYSYVLMEMNSTVRPYTAVVSSGSGQFIYAIASDDGIYRSVNYGNSLTVSLDQSSAWTSIDCSNDGKVLLATYMNGSVIKSVDFGFTWANTSLPVANWTEVSLDSSGDTMYAYSDNKVYYSYNSGGNWSYAVVRSNGFGLSCSADGQYVTLAGDAFISVSSSFGRHFTLTSTSHFYWNAVSVSSTGQYQAAAGLADGSFVGAVYISTNYGQDWTETLTGSSWSWVSMDANCSVLFAAGPSGVYVTLTNGQIWSQTDSPVEDYSSVSVSSDGQYLVGVVMEGGFYTNQYSIPTSMPSSQPSFQPSAVPSAVPSSQPSSQPSEQPHTTCPTSQPSVCPSSCPSAQPSSYPTYEPETYKETAVVQAASANSTYVFNNMGCDSHAVVSAYILVSYLDAATAGFVRIIATNGQREVVVSSYCAPTSLCSSVACAVNVNVSSVVSCSGGGSVTLFATTVNASLQTGVDTLCTYMGTPNLQYVVQYTLSYYSQPTASPTKAPVTASTDFVFEASPDTPFYIVVACILLMMLLGVFIVRLRDMSNSELSVFKLTSTSADLGMIGYHLASELFYIVILFDEHFKGLAVIVILIRLLSMVIAGFFLLISFGPWQTQTYSRIMNKTHLFQNASVYAIVVILMLFDQSMVRYLPWNANKYSLLSRGFPDQNLFKICVLSKLFQLFSTLIVQLVVIFHYDSYLFDGSNDIALALVLLYLVSSVSTIILFLTTNLVRAIAGKATESESTRETNNYDGDTKISKNPLRSVGRETELVESKRHSEFPVDLSEFVTYAVMEEKLQEREALLRSDFERRESLLMEEIRKLSEKLDA